MNGPRGKTSPPVQITAQHSQRTVSFVLLLNVCVSTCEKVNKICPLTSCSAPQRGQTPPLRQYEEQHTYLQSHHFQGPTYADMSKQAVASGRMPSQNVVPPPQGQYMRGQQQTFYIEQQDPNMWTQSQPYYMPNQQPMRQPRMPLSNNGQVNNTVFISGVPSMSFQLPPGNISYGNPGVQILQQPNQFMRMNYTVQPQQQQLPGYIPQYPNQGGASYAAPVYYSQQMTVGAPGNPNRPPSAGPQGSLGPQTAYSKEKRRNPGITIQDPMTGRDVTQEIISGARPASRESDMQDSSGTNSVATEFAEKVAAVLNTTKNLPDSEMKPHHQDYSPMSLHGIPSPHTSVSPAPLQVQQLKHPLLTQPPQMVVAPQSQEMSQETVQDDFPSVVNGEQEPETDIQMETDVVLPPSQSHPTHTLARTEPEVVTHKTEEVEVPSQLPVSPSTSPVKPDLEQIPEHLIKTQEAGDSQASQEASQPLIPKEEVAVASTPEVPTPALQSAGDPTTSMSRRTEEAISHPLSIPQETPKEECKIDTSRPVANSKDGRKSKRNKKDLNKRGESKEGTDMDAFYDAKKEELLTKPPNEVESNASSSTSCQLIGNEQADSLSKPPESELVIEIETETKVELEEQEPDSISPPPEVKVQEFKEPAVNLDSAEVIAEILPAESDKTGVLKKAVNGFELKYNYREDQWSPLNPEGKRQYDREFLLMLQSIPESCQRPQNLPEIPDIILDKISPMKTSGSLSSKSFPDFTPGFFSIKSNQRSSNTASISKRGSHQRRGVPSEQRVITTRVTEVTLHKSENAYRPGVHTDNVPKEDLDTQKLYRNVKAILNKLTPQKFDTLVQQVLLLPINTEERLKGVTDLVFEKALSEPNFSVAYASMCKSLLTLNKVPSSTKKGEFVQFRAVLLTKCQREFESDKKAELDLTEREKEIESAPEEKKAELREALAEATLKFRRRSTGNIRFIGELFKLKMLTENIMHDCVFKLLKMKDEESLECLCRLLATIGKELDTQKAKVRVDQYFSQMHKIKNDMSLPSRVRFMVQDVIELRQNNWIPRRNESRPTTIDQIHKEAAEEQLQQKLMLSLPMPKIDQQGQGTQRGKGAPKGGRGSMGGPSEDGWNTVSSKAMRSIDASKMKLSRQNVDENIQLGPGGGAKFSMWGKGSQGGGSRSQEAEKPAGNRYSLLNSMHEGDNRRSFGRSPARGDSHGRQDSRRDRDRDNRDRDSGAFARPKAVSRSSTESERERAVASTRIILSTGGGGAGSGSSNPPSRDASRDNSRSRDRPQATARPGTGPDATTMTQEAIENKTKAIIEEYLHNQDIGEATECFAEWRNLDKGAFVSSIITMVLERSSQARVSIGDFLFHLAKMQLLNTDELMTGLKEVLDMAEDYEIDIPKIWEYLGDIIGPMVLDNSVLPLQFLRQAVKGLIESSGKIKTAPLLAQALKVACQRKPHSHIAAQWRAAGLKMMDFVEADTVVSFIQKKELGWLEAGADAPSTPPAVSAHSPGWIQERLIERLSEKNNDSEKIFDFIEANTSEEEQRSKQFIRELMTAVCQNAISGGSGNAKLIPENIHYRRPVLVKYLEAKPENELQALYALQALVHSLEHPPGLLRNFFDILYDEEIINEDSFNRWAASDDPAEQEGKGVAKLNTTQFFVWLREGEEES